MDYDIISTGSKGNAVVIDGRILIDCGVPYVALEKYKRSICLVLLTHIHCDHFNKSTLKRLSNERPTLRFGCCEWLVQPLIDCGVDMSRIDCYDTGRMYRYFDFSISPIKLYHNVPNAGYRLYFGDYRLLYATDTNIMDGIAAKNYDLYTVECNYDDDEIQQRIAEKESNGQYAYERNVLNNHLSKTKCDAFLLENMSEKSDYVYMHQHQGGD